MPDDSARALGRLPTVALCMSVGVVLVAYAYGRGRAGQSWPQPFYWSGLLLLILAPAAVLLNMARRVTYREAIGIAIAIAVCTYGIKEAFSPIQFVFSDEFLHLVTINSILSTHHLFHSNPELTVSPYYPAMEIVTSAISLVSHLSVAASSIVLLASLHLLSAIALFLLCDALVASPRIAALSVVIYATSGDYLFFNSYFSYESIGLPFLLFTLLAFVKSLQSQTMPRRVSWTTATLVFGSVTVLAHHVSSYLLILFLLCVTGAAIASRTYRWLQLAIAPLLLLLVTAIWDLVIASPTPSYLAKTADTLITQKAPILNVDPFLITRAGASVLSDTPVGTTIPIGDTVFDYAWVLVLSFLLVVGLVHIVRRRREVSPILLGWSLAGASAFVAFGTRVIAPVGGGELATRLLSFTLIPGSLVCSVALCTIRLRGTGPAGHPRVRRSLLVLPILLVALLDVGGITSGWPPYYSNIPGPYVVAGRIRTVDAYDLDAAVWASQHLPPHSTVATDLTDSELLGALAGMDAEPSPDITYMFVSTRITPDLEHTLSRMGIDYILVDLQIGSGIPVDGNPIFIDDPFAGYYRVPIRPSALAKFNSLPGVSRIYSSGPIVIYDVKGIFHAKG